MECFTLKHHPGVTLGELSTSDDFLLGLGLTRDAGRSWEIGPHRYCANSAFPPGSGEPVLHRGSSPAHSCFLVVVRGSGTWTGGSRGFPSLVGNKIRGVEADSGKVFHYLAGSFPAPRDHAVEFIDLGKVFFSFEIQFDSRFNDLCLFAARRH